MTYTPPQQILERYAAVLVNFALGGGEGVKAGEVVRVLAPESAKPLYAELHKAVWRAGAHTISSYQPDDDHQINLSRDFFELASPEQLDHFNARYTRGMVDEMDHQVSVIAESDPHALDSVDPAKIMRKGEAMRPLLDWRGEKENAGRFTWTLGLYGTPAMAAEAGMSAEEYWEQIVHACYLDEQDPLARWREVGRRLDQTRERLDALEIERVHIEGEDVDLWITIGEQRRWLGGRGRNIPSFEIFTSPDWRGTEGWIYCNQPLYRYGNLVKGIRLTFKDGRVTDASAEENERVLSEMIATDGADRIGEFSLTDKRLLADHALHGAHALRRERRRPVRQHPHRGRALLPGRLRRRPQRGQPGASGSELGFNNSSVHTDIVSTTDRVVTAHAAGRRRAVIYRDGEFQLD
jgi:aminopeptidase